MKYLLMFTAAVISSSTYATMQAYDDLSTPVEYVRICTLYGTGYFYIPGTNTCVDAATGMTKYQTSAGTVNGQTQLAYRVSQLEKKLGMLMEETNGQ